MTLRVAHHATFESDSQHARHSARVVLTGAPMRSGEYSARVAELVDAGNCESPSFDKESGFESRSEHERVTLDE